MKINEQESETISHFGAIIRHAERSDYVKESDSPVAWNKVDPPLTPLGLEQAKATGIFLKNYFGENDFKFDKIVVHCSPFIRTMQSASQIALELGLEGDFEICYSASEVLLPHVYKDGNPMP